MNTLNTITRITSILAATVIGLLCCPAVSPAADTAPFKKPSWLTELSLEIKESYDSNIYLSGVDAQFLPPSYTVPPGGVAALKNRSSWVTTISPRVGVDLARPLESPLFQSILLGYAPDFVFYHDASVEDHIAHRFTAALKGMSGSLSFNLTNTFTYVDGSDVAPTYPGALLTAWNIVAPRNRREQIQDSANLAIQYSHDKWFVRACGYLLYFDLKTQLLDIAGYQNYIDRYDVNGGPDFGYKLNPNLALTVGYRYGHQYQQQLSFSPYSSPSDYHRLLFGIEGKPWRWLDLKLQAGPDFRCYEGDAATHITPVTDKHMTTYYGEAAATATLSPKDTLALRYKQYQWVSSVAKVPYFEGLFDLAYKHKLDDKFALDLGARLLTADYSSGNLSPSNQRNDWQYTFSAGLTYSPNTHCKFSLAYSLDLGRNMEDNIPNPQTREYERHLITIGLKCSF